MKVIINLVFALALVMLAMVVMSFAHASSWCPSKAEARDRYEHAHLFWHSDSRCWDNKRSNVRDWPHARPKIVAAEGSTLPLRVRLNSVDGGIADDGSTNSIWPDVPSDVAFSYRWPDTLSVSPLQWWREMQEFGQ